MNDRNLGLDQNIEEKAFRKKARYRKSINHFVEHYKSTRIGAGDFLTQNGRLQFTPEGDIEFRGVKREDSNQLIQEWDRWIRDLRTTNQDHVRNAASHAQPICSEHLDVYYRDQVVAESEITSLENSSKKLADSEQELIFLTQKRRAERNAQDDSKDWYPTSKPLCLLCPHLIVLLLPLSS
ncbi:hypothetical protein BKA57DRAFT_234538 [Linnemannia elongata]|nr:hypothetical protein BKA57DRAFT_234538 [Linnemannia elongata]